MSPDMLTVQALLNCLIREVSSPEEQAWELDGHVMVRLARSDRLLRAVTRRPSAGPGPRLTGEADLRHADGTWHRVGWAELAGLIARELTLATGTANDEFAGQVASSYGAIAAIMRAREASGGSRGGHQLSADPRLVPYLTSEQALVAGHRFHPASKAREGDPAGWLPFAPEAGARFPLRFLAVRADAMEEEGDTAGLGRLGGPPAPAGYRLLPAHPWQLRLLDQEAWLRQALRDHVLIDLGTGPREVVPTSSVRTVYDPVADVFCKFSLNVRITNCVRKSSWYELAGSVAMTGLLSPVFDDLAARFPGTALLGEPGYRTALTAVEEAAEGLSVILRSGLTACLVPGATPVLAASLTEQPTTGGARAPGSPLDGRDPERLLGWWDAYVRRVVPPVLHALFGHGVVLEPHLQNVLVAVDGAGLPVQAIFRDLEGVKLLSPWHDALLSTLKPGVARALAYDPERGWHRVAYCLFVNHLAEIAAAIADRCPSLPSRLEARLWDRVRDLLEEYARDHDWPPQLRAVLAGVPLPAKANLLTRWARAADREARYLRVRNPLTLPAMTLPAMTLPAVTPPC